MSSTVKPWQTQPTAQTSSSDLLNALSQQQTGLEAAPVDQQTANELTDPTSPTALNEAATNPTTGTSSLTSSYSPYSSGLSSSYGGYGGLGGMGMGMGGMGMYGMGGMGGMGMYGMDQNSSFFKTLQFMQSLGFVVNSMVQVVGSLEMNAQGIYALFQSVKNILGKVKGGVFSGFKFLKEKFFRLIYKILVLLRLAEGEGNDQEIVPQDEDDKEDVEKLKKLKRKKRIYKFLMKVAGVLILVSIFYFYSIGKSFKVEFLENVKSEDMSVGESVGDEFDKMMKVQ